MIDCNIKICVGCRMCEVICSLFHAGGVSPALSRIRVVKLEEIGLDMAVACLSCAEKSCLDCPNEALSIGAQSAIVLDDRLCDACHVCVDACPIGAVGFHEGRPLICDLCGGAVRCVEVCPTRALSYRDEYRGISLSPFRQSQGNPGMRRACYVQVRGEPLRESWKRGARVDS